MRKRLVGLGIVLLCVFCCLNTEAQRPPIHFQGMMRELNWVGDSVDLHIRLFHNDIVQSPEYVESQKVSVNAAGYVSVMIGEGIPTVSVWNDVIWDGGVKIIEIAFWSNGQWNLLVNQQLGFVPKALRVLNGWQGIPGELGASGVQGEQGPQGVQGPSGLSGAEGVAGYALDSVVVLGNGRYQQWMSNGTNYEWSFPPYYGGCTNPSACNYRSGALVDDGSCLIINQVCDDGDGQTTGDVIDGNCQCTGSFVLMGCTDSTACNYLIGATLDDGSCRFMGSSCTHPDPYIINEQIDENCVCSGVWKTYEKESGLGYKQWQMVGYPINDYDSVFTSSVIINGNEWACRNYSSEVLNNGDNLNINFPNSMQCAVRDWTGYYYNNCSGSIFFGDYGIDYYYSYGFFPDQLNSFRYRYFDVSNFINGLCPTGWHIATDSDWQNVIDFFGGDEFAGQRIKIAEQWPSIYNDYSGLNIKPDQDPFEYTSATWWSPSADAPPGKMWIRKITSNSPKVYRYLVDESEYHSVRCVKNQ